MQVAVVGANGGIGRELVPHLAEAGHNPIGIVRDDSHFDAVRQCGGESRLGDLESESHQHSREPTQSFSQLVPAGTPSGTRCCWSISRGARRRIDVCVEHDIDRFVMISAYSVSEPLAEPTALRPYRVAKRCTDDYLEWSPLNATILRPTTLIGKEGTGQVSAAFEYRGDDGDVIPHADVAQTIVACLKTEKTIGETIRLFGGDTPIKQAIRPDN